MERYRFELLTRSHARDQFSSGIPALDRYLQQRALQDKRSRVAVPWVGTPDGRCIASYVALCTTSIELAQIPPQYSSRLPKYPHVPAALIGRLAVDQRCRGRGLGATTLLHALRLVVRGGEAIAAAAVVADAKDASAAKFYFHFGFSRLSGTRVYLPIQRAEAMVRDLETNFPP